MPRPDLILHQQLFSDETVERFPSLRSTAARQYEVVDDLYRDMSSSRAWEENEVLRETSGEDATAALDFYNAVVEDGRYVALLATEPETVAGLLKKEVSGRTIEIIKEGTREFLPGDLRANVAVTVVTVGVAVTVAVVTKGKNPIEELIIDHSCMVKV